MYHIQQVLSPITLNYLYLTPTKKTSTPNPNQKNIHPDIVTNTNHED